MKSILLILLIVSSINCEDLRGTLEWNDSIDIGSIKYIPNVQYLGQGYNIFTSNPYSSQGLDTGYKNVAAVNLTYADNLWQNANPERNYFVPNGVLLSQQKSCTMSFSAKQIDSMTEYSRSLDASVAIRGTFFGGKFRASADYQSTQNQMSSGEYSFIISNSQCSVFQLDLVDSPSYHAQLTNDILQNLNNLALISGNQDEANSYYDFFDNWGTHVVTSVDLGSLFGYKFKMLKTDISNMKKSGIDVKASATIFNVRGRSSTQEEKDNLNSFTQSIQSWTSYSIGATPDANNDPAQWATQTLTKPMPIKSGITPYHEALRIFTQGNNSVLSSSQIILLYSKLRMYANSYCSKRLLPNGRINQCKSDNQEDYSFSQLTRLSTYSYLSFLDITRTQILNNYRDEITKQRSVQLAPINSTPGQRFFLKVNYYNPSNSSSYYVSVQDSFDRYTKLVANYTIGQPALITSAPTDGTADFTYVAYDESFFSLKFKSDPSKCLGFNSTGQLVTMETDSCFECQTMQIISNIKFKNSQ